MRLQTNRDITLVLLRRKESKFGASATRRSRHFGGGRENGFNDVHLSISFGQRSAASGNHIDDERTFIHFGQKSTAGATIREHARYHQNQRGNGHPRGVMQHRSQGVCVPHRERVECATGTCQHAAAFSD